MGLFRIYILITCAITMLWDRLSVHAKLKISITMYVKQRKKKLCRFQSCLVTQQPAIRRVAFNNDPRQLLLFSTLISLEVGFEKDRKPMRPKAKTWEGRGGKKWTEKDEEGVPSNALNGTRSVLKRFSFLSSCFDVHFSLDNGFAVPHLSSLRATCRRDIRPSPINATGHRETLPTTASQLPSLHFVRDYLLGEGGVVAEDWFLHSHHCGGNASIYPLEVWLSESESRCDRRSVSLDVESHLGLMTRC
jgi:hypothetical protein